MTYYIWLNLGARPKTAGASMTAKGSIKANDVFEAKSILKNKNPTNASISDHPK